jgi:hypothetical protein
LIRTAHLALIQLGCIEQVKIDFLNRAAPPSIMGTPPLAVMGQEPLTAGIAVIVEGDDSVRHISMASPETFDRNYPLCVKSFERGMLKEDTRKDVARTVAEEDAVWQPPLLFGIFLDALL